MLHQASDIATSTPDPFDGGCPADTELARIIKSGIISNSPAQKQIDILTAENARLTVLNEQLRTGIRDADASIKRMLGEIDDMVAKLLAAGGGK